MTNHKLKEKLCSSKARVSFTVDDSYYKETTDIIEKYFVIKISPVTNDDDNNDNKEKEKEEEPPTKKIKEDSTN